jgi:hypothetical protein
MSVLLFGMEAVLQDVGPTALSHVMTRSQARAAPASAKIMRRGREWQRVTKAKQMHNLLEEASLPNGSSVGMLDGGLSVEAKAEILHDAANKICNTFPGNMCSHLIEGARAVGPEASQGVQLREALGRKMSSGQPFVFGAMGSSVSAGHDNHPNTSWPFELSRLLKPTFERLGFGFELRQRSVGGWGEAPTTVGCMKNRVGAGVDAVSWEWGMFYDSGCVLDNFLQEAYGLNGPKEHPPVVMSLEDTSASIKNFRPHINDSAIPELRKKAFAYLDLEGELDKRRWRPNEWYLTNEFISPSELSKWEQDTKPTEHSFMRPFSLAWQRDQESSHSSHYEAVTGRKPSKEVQAELDKTAAAVAASQRRTPYLMINSSVSQFVDAGFGYEPFFATAGIDAVPHEWRAWYTAREKAFNINWHPGPLGHLLIASQLAHYMLTQARASLFESSAEIPVPKVPALERKCGAPAKSCATGMMPHEGKDINDLVVGEGWPQVDTQDRQGTIDKHIVLQGGINKSLTLKVRAVDPGDVAVVCMDPCGWFCKPHTALPMVGKTHYWPPAKENERYEGDGGASKPVVNDVDFSLDGRRITSEMLNELGDKVLGKKGSFCADCDHIKDLCQPVAELQGEHELMLEVSPRTTPGDKDMKLNLLMVMVVPGPQSP